ncbi:hypothetical protein CDAR_290721 [Caerostris darwini]|uniref:Uncharacterized protein n=1 Tax=Caerostris darwini TaxID=1538125 RepID=A0AAV4STS2_9ARAC|nr:hypothetical protein CDAR_290721 [Caerostris darwini]
MLPTKNISLVAGRPCDGRCGEVTQTLDMEEECPSDYRPYHRLPITLSWRSCLRPTRVKGSTKQRCMGLDDSTPSFYFCCSENAESFVLSFALHKQSFSWMEEDENNDVSRWSSGNNGVEFQDFVLWLLRVHACVFKKKIPDMPL